MVLTNTEGRPYYYRHRPTGRSSPRQPKPEHDVSVLGFGLALGDESIWVSFSELQAAAAPIDLELGGQCLKFFFDQDGMTAWAEDDGEAAPATVGQAPPCRP